MKKITILWLLLVLPSIIFSQNLILDGTFNTQTGAITGSTSDWAGYGAQIVASDDLTSSSVGNINNGEGAIRQNFAIVASTTYQVNFDYRWVSGSGNFNMTVRFRRQTAPAGNLTISNVTGGTINGGNDGFVANTTPDVWYKASFRVTIPSGVTESRLQFFKSNGNRPFRMDNVTVRKLAIFDGSTDSDWATADNWDTNEIPEDDDVIIPGAQNVIISSSTGAEVGNIDIDGAGSLTINGGGSLDVNGTPTGNITYNRTLVAGKWHLLGSPVDGETYDDAWVTANGIASGVGNNRGIATFQNGAADPTTGQWVYMQSLGSGNFTSSTGYSLIRTASGNVSFTGTYPTGSKPATVSNANTNKFNLISNPYPTYLAVSEFFTNNVEAKFTEKTIWIWDQSANSGAGGYIQKTSDSDASFEIAPGQAFFISSGNGNQIEFFQFNGGSATDTFLKTNRTELSLSIKEDKNTRTTDLYYINEGTKDFDNGYDASLFSGVKSDFSIYTKLVTDSNKALARQVLPLAEMESIIVPVGIKVAANKEISFIAKASNLPQGAKVYLEDRLLNTFTSLNETNSSYKITTTEALNGAGRFFLHTTSGALSTNDIDLQNVSIFKLNNSKLKIVGLSQGKASIKLYNILGKQMMTQSFETSVSNEISLPRLAKGMYIVQLETKQGKLSKKIILE